jgi:hypothetical protein
MELNVDTVLAAVNDLHARTGKRIFTLIEIAEALSDGQRVTPPGRHGPTDAECNRIPGMSPPVPAWVEALNENREQRPLLLAADVEDMAVHAGLERPK